MRRKPLRLARLLGIMNSTSEYSGLLSVRLENYFGERNRSGLTHLGGHLLNSADIEGQADGVQQAVQLLEKALM